MAKSKKEDGPDETEDQDEALEAFLDQALEAAEEEPVDLAPSPGEPRHRRLQVAVSDDRLEARLQAVFPDTTFGEVQGALKQTRVVWGVQEDALKEALERANRSGRRQPEVLAAKGRPAVFRKRKEVRYPFLEGLAMPDTGEPVHLASSIFREIAGVMGRARIEQLRGYGHQVMAVTDGTVLREMQGEDEIAPGQDVFGKVIRTVEDETPGSLKAGDGVNLLADGSLTARSFGYVSVTNDCLSVISPIWISQDRMEAYFINPPQLGKRRAPAGPEEILGLLQDLRIGVGVDREVIDQMCLDLKRGDLRESCVRIARGDRPRLSKGQIVFTFDPLPPARFERVREAFRALDLERVAECEVDLQAVGEGVVLAEQAEAGDESAPGRDLFGEPVAPSEEVQEQKLYQAGIHVRREVEGGLVRFVSEVYGYAGVLDDQILVLPPIWISPDKMAVYFVALPQGEKPALPAVEEVEKLLEQAQVRYGVDPEAVARLSQALPTGEGTEGRTVLLAQGTPPEPGHDGRVELLFKQKPDPGTVLEEGKMDFRERDGVPRVHPGDLLAQRTLPTPGRPGTDVRGRTVKSPPRERGLLYAGPNVTAEERENEQLFFATGSGWARVVKDTLGVLQRFRHQGDLDYQVGNLRIEGDVEIGGTVKSRFRVEATGDVYIGGTVERGARVTAGGNVVVAHGIVGARVRAGGDLHARFIQDSEVNVGQDLVVRNYVQDSQVQVHRKATLQGNEGGEKQLCLMGGVLLAAFEIDAASIGSEYRKQTRAVAGLDLELDARLEKYREGLAFSDMRSRRTMRSLESILGRRGLQEDPVAAMRRVSPGRRQFLARQLKELETMKKLTASLNYHIERLNKVRTEVAGRGRIRVSGTAFQGVTVQVGDVYQALDREVPAVVFRLNHERTQVVQEFLKAGAGEAPAGQA